MAQTLEQKRAAFAWEVAASGIAHAQDKYTKLAKGAPALVMGSGLMQTLAFLRDKKEDQHQQLLEHLLLWLARRFDGETTSHAQFAFPNAKQPNFERTMQALFYANPQQFQRATSEVMHVLRWIRQMASAR